MNLVSKMPRRKPHAPTVELYRELPDGTELEVTVEYHYVRAETGYMCGRHVCPPSPDYVELGNAFAADGSAVDLSDDEADKAEASAIAFERSRR
jgi:hypothetical protein